MKPLKIASLFLAFLLGCQLALPAFADGSYLIYFDTSGGTGVPVIASTTSSGKLSQLPTPTMSGYTFEGWYTDELEGDKITLNTEFGADTTIYAHWVANLKDRSPSVDTSSAPASSFKLKDHAGTLLVAGTLLFTFIVISAR